MRNPDQTLTAVLTLKLEWAGGSFFFPLIKLVNVYVRVIV
jgi:hypothetical protein